MDGDPIVPKLKFEMSPQIGTLIAALAKARKAFKPVIKSANNPFFKSKYADLAEVIEATKDGLSDNGLAVLQPPAFERASGLVEILTIVAHSSDQWIKCWLEMPTSKGDAQGVGSAITYGRRYAYSAVLNVASEADDDGNAASGKNSKDKESKAEETNEEFDQRTAGEKNISVSQIQEIDAAIRCTGKTEEQVMAALGFIGEKRIEHIKVNAYDKFLKWAGGPTKTDSKSKAKAAIESVGGTAIAAAMLQSPEHAKALKALFAYANELHIPEGDVKQAAYERYKVDSMTKLTTAQLVEHRQWVKEVSDVIEER